MFFTNAFVLFYKDVNEVDRRYFLLTEEFGKIEAIVKMILKPNSKLAGHLEPPNFAWVELIEKGNGFQLTQALEQKSFPGLRKNPGALSLILRVAELINGFLGEDPSGRVFSIWGSFLEELEKSSGKKNLDWQFFEAQVVLRILGELGFLPEISSSPLASKLGSEFFLDCRKILAGEILFESRARPAIKKIALLFRRQAEDYMV